MLLGMLDLQGFTVWLLLNSSVCKMCVCVITVGQLNVLQSMSASLTMCSRPRFPQLLLSLFEVFVLSNSLAMQLATIALITGEDSIVLGLLKTLVIG